MLGLTHSIINNFLNHVFHAIWFYMLALEPKYSKKKTALLSILAAVIGEAISLFCFMYFDSKMQALTITFYVASVAYAFFYIFLMQGGKKLKSLFIYFTYICIWAAMYVVVMIITRNLLGGWQPAMWILRSILNLLFLYGYHRYFKERLLKSMPAVEKASDILIVASGMIYLVVPTLMIYYAYSDQTIISLLCVIFLLCFCLTYYFFIFRFIRQVGKEKDTQAIELQNKYLSETAQNFEILEREAKKDRHDYKHHNAILLQYARSGNTQAIIEYLDGFEAREEKKYARLCANPVVDNILRAYLRKAEQVNAVMDIKTEMDVKTYIQDIDLVAILANILENAVNGCENAPEPRKIDVSIQKKGIKLVFEVKNTASGNIRFENGIPKRKRGEGVGVQSMILSAERYQGDVIFNYENGIFACCVILNDINPEKT